MNRDGNSKMDWTPKKIRIELMRSDVRQADIARECGVSHTAVMLVINGKSVSDQIRRAIATAVGHDVKEIWPSYYLANRKSAVV